MRDQALQQLIKNKYIQIILIAFIVMACPKIAYATQYVPDADGPVTYDEQQINNFTGEVITDNEQQMTGEIPISSNCVYDKEEKSFVYKVDSTSGKKVISNIGDGMITNGIVSIDIGSADGFALYKDGLKLARADFNRLEEKGVYVLLFDGRKVLEFTIAGEYSCFQKIVLPEGFSVVSVKLDDGIKKGYGSGQVIFDEEGKYAVTYQNDYTGERYSFTTIIDHTPPVLALEALDEENKARGPVDISDVEPGGKVTVLLNGREIETSGKLTQNGPYTVTVYDAAGNSTSYNFLIMLYFNISGIGFLLAVIGLVVGLGIYEVVSAKRLRIC